MWKHGGLLKRVMDGSLIGSTGYRLRYGFICHAQMFEGLRSMFWWTGKRVLHQDLRRREWILIGHGPRYQSLSNSSRMRYSWGMCTWIIRQWLGPSQWLCVRIRSYREWQGVAWSGGLTKRIRSPLVTRRLGEPVCHSWAWGPRGLSVRVYWHRGHYAVLSLLLRLLRGLIHHDRMTRCRLLRVGFRVMWSRCAWHSSVWVRKWRRNKRVTRRSWCSRLLSIGITMGIVWPRGGRGSSIWVTGRLACHWPWLRKREGLGLP